MQQNAERNADGLGIAKALAAAAQEPVLILDPGLSVVFANPPFRDAFPLACAATQGVPIAKLAGGERNMPALYGALKAMTAGGKGFTALRVENEWPARANASVLINARPAPGPRCTLIMLSIRDVAPRDEMAVRLEEQNARLDSVLQAAQLGIVTIDCAGIVKSFSRAAEAMLGYRADDILGKNVSILMPEPHSAKHDGYIAAYLRTGEKKAIGKGMEVLARRKDGALIPVDLSIAEASFDHDRVFSGVMRDLSLEKKRQEELVQCQKMEAMGQLTGGVAHDFNNLLTVILGNLELIESSRSAKHQAAFLRDAKEAVNIGAELTRGLLAFGRRLPLEPQNVDVNEFIIKMIKILKRTIPESISVSAVLGKNLWQTVIDPAQLQNAILNLGLNARDAMPEGGKLIIETSSVNLDADYAAIHQDVTPGDYVAVSVTDTGRGMTPDVTRRAFEPFFTTKEAGKGSGLGLSMIYGFVKQSGGHVSIYSDAGHGATVTMFFPRCNREKPEKKTTDTSQGFAKGAGERVLIVEDDPRVLTVTRRRLEALGYRVCEAENGAAALAYFDAGGEADILFTDVIMPGALNGFELAQRARARKPGLKVLFTSGYAEEALSIGGDERILRKPYAAKALAKAIREVLRAAGENPR